MSVSDAVGVRYQPFDHLATLVAVVSRAGDVLFSNSALEDALGISRRTIVGSSFFDVLTEPLQLQSALQKASGQLALGTQDQK